MQSVETPMVSHDFFSVNPQEDETRIDPLPAPAVEKECEPMQSASSYDVEHAPTKPENSQYCYPVFYPAYISPVIPSSYTYWSGCNAEPTKRESHVVLRPTAVHSKSPINVNELVGMSKLSLGASGGSDERSSLSIKLIEGSSRQSAFHAKPTPSSSGMASGNSAIHAV